MNSAATTLSGELQATADYSQAAATARIHSIDIVRGLVMVLMALDHVRDFFSSARVDLLDPSQTSVALYLTRWTTHLCAPTFILLAGVSAQRMSTRMTTAQLSRFLLTRGAWLIALEVTVMMAAWTFHLDYSQGVFLQVIWAIGASMIVLAALVYLPVRAVAITGIAIIALHNLLDPITPAMFGAWAPLWNLLHVQGMVPIGFVSYPLIPWIGVMAFGYALGTLYDGCPLQRRIGLRTLGSLSIVLFLMLRLVNVYGDPHPWEAHATLTATLMSFFDVEKYPPSLAYLLATIGVACHLLAAAEVSIGAVSRRVCGIFKTFGRVPLFFYVAHIVLAHLLAGLLAAAMGFGAVILTSNFASVPKDWGVDLPLVYCAWIAVLALLYPACRWFGAVKRRRNDWWLSYV